MPTTMLLLTGVFLVAVIRQSCAAISCYNCTGSSYVPESGDNTCGSIPSNPTDAECDYCQISATATPGIPGIVNTFKRSCVPVNATGITVGCQGNTCTCQTDKCNNQKIYWRGSLNCYVCTSSVYMEDGCGQNFDPNSTYVQRVGNCLACGLSIYPSDDGGTYARTCVNTLDSKDPTCSVNTGVGTPPCYSLRCTTDLCNGNTNTFNGVGKLACSRASVTVYFAVAFVLLAIKNSA